MTRTKAAIIRDPNAPMFAPADMWLECCGGKVMVQRVVSPRIVLAVNEPRCPVCFALYDQRGNLVVSGKEGAA